MLVVRLRVEQRAGCEPGSAGIGPSLIFGILGWVLVGFYAGSLKRAAGGGMALRECVRVVS